ncbi:hypothetical protein [Halorussus halophilus]|nr:hypothetical protein [Halorussus halophilus]
MGVCDICEQRKSDGTELVARIEREIWVCHGCMMKAVTTKAERLSYQDW